MKFAHIEKGTNKILGWYDNTIHKDIPTPNVEVTDDVWQNAINNNYNAYTDGEFAIFDFRTDEELVSQEMAEYKTYLKSTDYINDKYKEDVELFNRISHEDFLAKHEDVYIARDNARNEINMLEKELENIN